MDVRAKQRGDEAWVRRTIADRWGSTLIASVSGLHDATLLDGLIAEIDSQPFGLLTHRFDDDACELVTIDSMVPDIGIGTALLTGAADVARVHGCRRLWLVTTNDNLPALRFYQRRGLTLVALHRNVVEEWRRTVKPGISKVGHDGIPIQHALELELRL